MKTRKEREKTGKKWARYSLRSVAGRELTKDQLGSLGSRGSLGTPLRTGSREGRRELRSREGRAPSREGVQQRAGSPLRRRGGRRKGRSKEAQIGSSSDFAGEHARLDFFKLYEQQVIPPIGAEGLNRRPPAGPCRLFLGPGFRLGARWNRLVETVKTRKKREFSGKKWARYGLRSVNQGS